MRRNDFVCRLIGVLLCVTLAVPTLAQGSLAEPEPFRFVDGFHGGFYGHYPIATYTDYMAEQLESHPGWKICLEIEPETWDTVAVRTPAALERFRRLAATPRVEFTNPAYAQPYMYNIYGESIIRNLGYGIAKIRQHFPDAEFLTYAVEEPCFTSCLPGVLGGFGFRYASLKCPNTCWGGYAAPFGHGNVAWTGPDGSVILTAPRYACEDLGDDVWTTQSNGLYPDFLNACREAEVPRPVGMCYQDAGWTNGPWLGKETGLNVKDSPYVTWREYFEAESDGTPHEVYRMPQEDVRGGLVWGSQVLQKLAREVRQAENKLLQTEKAAALLNLASGQVPDQALIDEAWRTLMLSQHHDCWIVPYNRLNKRGSWADNVALWTEASQFNCDQAFAMMQAFMLPRPWVSPSRPGPAPRSYASALFVNTAPFARTGLVRIPIPQGWPDKFRIEDPAGNAVPYYVSGSEAVFRVQAAALGFSYVKLSLEGKNTYVPLKKVSVKPSTKKLKVKGGMYELTFSPERGGVVTSLRTSDGREYVDESLETALGELKGFFYNEDCWHSSTENGATITVSSAKGIAATVTVQGSIAGTPFTQEYLIEDGNRLISCKLHIDWTKDPGIGKFAQKDAYNNRHRAFYDSRYDLSLYFPLASEAPVLYKDAPFDVCESSLKDTFFDRWDEIKHNVILGWVDLCGKDGRSLALLTDHTTSYTSGPGIPLALTVQFSGNGLWGRNYSIKGPTDISYAIIPHEGRWDEARIQEENLAWNEPVMVLPEPAGGAESFLNPVSADPAHPYRSPFPVLDLDGTGYLLSAMYVAGDGLVMRLYNASGDAGSKTLSLGFEAKAIGEVNLLGEPLSSCKVSTADGKTSFETSIPRFGIKTFKITRP